jgi:hypothetical protein
MESTMAMAATTSSNNSSCKSARCLMSKKLILLLSLFSSGPLLWGGCGDDAHSPDPRARTTTDSAARVVEHHLSVDPAVDVRLEAWSAEQELTEDGAEVLYLRTRVRRAGADADILEEFEAVRDARLSRVALDVMSIPVGPLSAQLGFPVVSRSVIEHSGDGESLSETQYLFRPRFHQREQDQETSGRAEGPAPEAAEPGPPPDLRSRVAQELRSREDLYEPDGTLVVTLVFAPRVEPDAPYRVDWLNGVDDVGSRRAAILAAETRLRQPEVQAAIDAGVEWLASLEMACRVRSRMRATNGVVLEGCSADDVLRIAERDSRVDNLTLGAPRNEVLQTFNGGDLRAIRVLQTRVALNTDEAVVYAGEGPNPSSASDNIRVALVDQEGYYGANRHPAYFDTPQPGNSCNNIVMAGTTRVSTFNCGYGGCSPFDSWGTSPFNHGMRTLAPFAHVLENQDPCLKAPATSLRWEVRISA